MGDKTARRSILGGVSVVPQAPRLEGGLNGVEGDRLTAKTFLFASKILNPLFVHVIISKIR
jgi:hypothetical protein